jgi:hypothetical protein
VAVPTAMRVIIVGTMGIMIVVVAVRIGDSALHVI